VSATTIVTADVANMWYGGLYGSSDSYLYDADSPLVAGHAHDGVHADGHAQKIHLVDHVTDQITNLNVGTNAITPRTVNYYTLEENAIPYIDSDGMYKLNLSMITPTMGFGAFIEIEADNLIRHTNEDYSEDGADFVFGSSSLDDIGVDPTPSVIEDGDYRFLFDRDMAAFRAGYVNLDQWDEFNRGWGSAALGSNSIASGVGSIALGTGHSVLGDFSSVLGGHSNDIDIDSTYSVITGGYQNDISNSTHSIIACGHSNQITNSTFSSIIAGCENHNGGTSSAVGGYGVELSTGAGSFVWGYDSGIRTKTAGVDQLFIIGTGAVDNDEKYRLGVNTRAPSPAGEMGAHIVGSTDAGSSPLRLTNLTNSDSKDALCVDSDGNVFVSDHELCEECGDYNGTKTSTYWLSDHTNENNDLSRTVFAVENRPGGVGKVIELGDISIQVKNSGDDFTIRHQVAQLRSEFVTSPGVGGWVKPVVSIPFELPVGQSIDNIVLIGDGSLTSDYTFTVEIFQQKRAGGSVAVPSSSAVILVDTVTQFWDASIAHANNWINITFSGFSTTNAQAGTTIMNTYYAQFSYINPDGTPDGDGGIHQTPNEDFHVMGMNATTSFTTLEAALGVVLTP